MAAATPESPIPVLVQSPEVTPVPVQSPEVTPVQSPETTPVPVQSPEMAPIPFSGAPPPSESTSLNTARAKYPFVEKRKSVLHQQQSQEIHVEGLATELRTPLTVPMYPYP
ncbi:unnamed protein product [Leuciscus chuanchicus]